MNAKHQEHRKTFYKRLLKKIYVLLEENCIGYQGNRRSIASVSVPFSGAKVKEILSLGRETQGLIENDLIALAKIHQLAESISMNSGARVGIIDIYHGAVNRLRPQLRNVEDGPKKEILFLLVCYLRECGVPEGQELYGFTSGIMIYSFTEGQTVYGFGSDEEVDIFGLNKADLEVLKKRVSERYRKIHKELAPRSAEKFTVSRGNKSTKLPRQSAYPGTLKRGSLLPVAKRRRNA